MKLTDIFKQKLSSLKIKIETKTQALLFPSLGLYKHHKGKTYKLLCITNQGTTDPKFIPTAVYENTHTGDIFSRPVSEFKEKFTKC